MSRWRERAEDRRKRDEEYGNTIRGLIRHENDVTNHRTTWLLVFEALLAAGATNLLKEHPGVTIGIGFVGIIVAISIAHTLQNSLDSRVRLKALWRKRLTDRGYDIDDMLPVDGTFPDTKAKWWLLPGQVIPGVLIVAWGLFVAYVYLQAFAR